MGFNMTNFNNIIIGAGASGCLCAIKLKENNLDCALIDASERILKKLLVTGNGRCNISNTKIVDNFNIYYSSSTTEDFKAFNKFAFNETMEELENIGFSLTTLEGGKVYPFNLQASSAVDLFRLKLEELQVPIFLSERIKDISFSKGKYILTSSKNTYTCNNLIIATGGMAMPSTGSDGSMFKILKSMGYKISKPLPALVQLKLESRSLRALSGVKFEGSATLKYQNEEITEDGEILFTDYGISGPPILQLSRHVAPLLDKGEQLTLHLNLFNMMSKDALKEEVYKKVNLFKERTMADLLNGFINKKIIPIIFKESGLEKMTTKVKDVDITIINNIIEKLTNWEFKIIGDNGFANAQSTYGGVSMDEINQYTMESKKYPNMYILGEALDVCGACGGYNLQWAWTSALSAANSIINTKKSNNK